MYLRCLLSGNNYSGKTTLYNNLLGVCNNQTIGTVGLKSELEFIEYKFKDKTFKVTFIDIPGRAYNEALIPRQCYRDIEAVFILIDPICASCLSDTDFWISKAEEVCDIKKTKIYILANKCDIESEWKVNYENLKDYAREKAVKLFKISALKESIHKNSFFDEVLKEIEPLAKKEGGIEGFKLKTEETKEENGSNCSC